MGNEEVGTKGQKVKANGKGSAGTLHSATGDADKGLTKRKRQSPVDPCPPRNEIVAVEILDGGNKVATGTVKQYANLPRDAKWLDGSKISNIDRLSEKLRMRVRFKKPGRESFKLKLIPGAGNATYSQDEKKRNAKYDYTSQERSYVTDPDGTKIVEDFSVAAAGGDKYWAEAKDLCGKKAKSTEVETIRRLFFQEIYTKGLPGLSNSIIQTIQKEFQNHHVELVFLPGAHQLKHDGIIRTDADLEAFQSALREAYRKSSGKDKAPYVVVFAHGHSDMFSRHLELTWPKQKVGPGVNDLVLALKERSEQHFLWTDRQGTVSLGARFMPDGSRTWKTIDQVTPVVSSTGPAGKYDRVRLRVNHLFPTVTVGTIRVKAVVVLKSPAGRSLEGDTVVLFCYSYWQRVSDNFYGRICLHEIGHKIGMVPDGSDLDKGKYYYDQKSGLSRTQWGPHCYNGLPPPDKLDGYAYDIDAEKGGTFELIDVEKRKLTKVQAKPKCIMFGLVGSGMSFCDDCSKKVRKKDLSNPDVWKWKSRYW